jgi:RHS repeat-associated protein
LQGERSLIPFRQLGQYEDVETGLYYNRFRYYSPETGAYISQDPIGLAGGMAFYGYVGDSNAWTDPLGLTRRGNSATRAQNANVRDQFLLDNPNSSHIGGSTIQGTNTKLPETYLEPRSKLASSRKGGSYADLTFEMQDGTRVYVQTVDTGSINGMSLREWDNANRIMRQDPDAIIITVRKGQSLNPGDLDVNGKFMKKGSIHVH